MEPDNFPELAELEAVRGNRVLLYHSALTDNSVSILYECLRKQGRDEPLDLVLSTVGGSVTVARRIALLLREFTRKLTIVVPYRARSAGTLLCLGADQLVLGPMAELGPIDSHIGSVGVPPDDAPSMISAEDVRAFREMAEDWFKVDRDEDRLQVLALIAQRVFPTSLASFYRFDKLVRQVAHELLAHQLPDAEAIERQGIVDRLVAGYHAHDYVLSRAEVRELGLTASDASRHEESLLWDLVQAIWAQTAEEPGSADEQTIGLVVSRDFFARQMVRRSGSPPRHRDDPRHEDVSRPRGKKRANWFALRNNTLRDGDTPNPGDRTTRDPDWENARWEIYP